MRNAILPSLLLVGVLVVGALLPASARAKARRSHTVQCCVPIDIPGVTPGPVCKPINFNVRPRRFATKRFCTLIGGAAPVDGACTCPQ